jgi:hypothetical protein
VDDGYYQHISNQTCSLPLPSGEGATQMVSTTSVPKWLKSRPESGLDCVISAESARQRSLLRGGLDLITTDTQKCKSVARRARI